MSTMICYQCDKAARTLVTKRCRSKGGVEFDADLHATCVASYARSLASFGSRIIR